MKILESKVVAFMKTIVPLGSINILLKREGRLDLLPLQGAAPGKAAPV